MRNACRVSIGFCFCFLFVVGAQDAQEGKKKAVKETVAVARVTETDDTETRRYTGLVVSPSTVDLVAQVSGELMETPFKEGTLVRKGQVLFILDDVPYVAAVKKLEAEIAENKAHLAYAQRTYERNDALYKQKVGSQDDMESALSDQEAYKAAIQASEASLISAKNDLKHTRVAAPIDGRIGVRNFTKGNYITTSSGALAMIVQLDPVRVRFSISNRDFLTLFGSETNLVQNGEVRIGLADGSRYNRTGRFDFIDNEANQKTDARQIYVLFDNPEGVLLTGGTVSVYLTRKSGKKVSAVLPSAVIHDAQGVCVYVLNDKNVVVRRNVTLGPVRDDIQAVAQGLAVGERVVTDGMHKVMPGSEVEAVETPDR